MFRDFLWSLIHPWSQFSELEVLETRQGIADVIINTFYMRGFKGQLQRFYKFMSYERAFKMLKNDTCIIEIGQAVLEL